MFSNEEIEKTFKALDDSKRIEIIKILQDGEKCACHIMERTQFTQSALSYQMKILCDSNLVTSRQQGKWTHYSINREGKASALKMIDELLNSNK